MASDQLISQCVDNFLSYSTDHASDDGEVWPLYVPCRCGMFYPQGNLLEPELATNVKLMLALDTLNQRFGRGTVKVSTQGAYREWQMRQECKSPDYTTWWK